MSNTKFSYHDLRFFSDLIKDYLLEKESVREFYGTFPKLENFKVQIAAKQESWGSSQEKRTDLSEVLTAQYRDLKLNKEELVAKNIASLKESQTFTITTGHQLNLFTGPLYFLYKIASTINLCKELSAAYPDQHFVPVYWMATEDHDFEEIQYFNYGDRKIVYERESQGAVGRMSTEGLEEVSETFSKYLGNHDHAIHLKTLFKKAYTAHKNLADATRYLAHELFGSYGLVIVDGDDAQLKSHATAYFKTDLLQHLAMSEVSKTITQFKQDHNVQVNPRDINLFYLTDHHRGRIIKNEDLFLVDGLEISFTQKQLLDELEQHPERFSPNVILRPLYQEVILPNLCYIGGGGEIAYWLELKSFFEASEVVFPILLLRNSAQLVTSKNIQKAAALDLKLIDLFKKPHELETQVTHQVSDIEIDFSSQKQHLKDQFAALYELARNTDKSFETAVAAQEQKQINGLEKLEKRLLKAQKRKLSDQVSRALLLQSEFLPQGGLQERVINFSYYYETYGPDLIDRIMESLRPLDLRFTCIDLG
jgi:bacillithiol biosynthesis cysteine-adding enzyme BshC